MIKVFSNKDRKLIDLLKSKYEIEEIKLPSLMQKLTFKPKQYPDIYFHGGKIDETAKDMIKNCKKVIVNSFGARHKIMLATSTSPEKIEVVYPSVEPNTIDPKDARGKLSQFYDINKKTKIILFVSNDFKMGGVKEFLHIISRLKNKNFLAFIIGRERDASRLQFALNQHELSEKIKTLSKEKLEVGLDELYSAADIYVAPTYINSFSNNVLKAMAAKCAVFVSANNDAREIVDVFATMSDPNDPSSIFKVEALVDGHELKSIKKQNKKDSKKYSKENQLNKLDEIITKIST